VLTGALSKFSQDYATAFLSAGIFIEYMAVTQTGMAIPFQSSLDRYNYVQVRADGHTMLKIITNPVAC
jgi:hypothetical protein